MKPKNAIKLNEVPLVKQETILQKIYFLRMGCIDAYYNLVKNTMTIDAEQLIGYGQRELMGLQDPGPMWGPMDLNALLYRKSLC